MDLDEVDELLGVRVKAQEGVDSLGLLQRVHGKALVTNAKEAVGVQEFQPELYVKSMLTY